MDIKITGKDLVVTGLGDFNLKHIFDCGQCFRWNCVDDNTYLGVAMNKALRISQSGDTVTFFETSEADFYDVWRDYFDLDTDYGKIKNTLASDAVLAKASSFGGGIRILKQDLWESVISFIISASNNIPRIKGIIERMCALYGNRIEYMGNTYYSFPTTETLASLRIEDLSQIRAGFRDKYILDAAQRFKSGLLSEDYIRSLPTGEAKKALMTVSGIGNKVADCVLLFGLHRTESFPVDVWVKRVMEYFYFDSPQTIDTVMRFAEEKFGTLGGYAQQYLFFYAREERIGV